MDRCVHPHKRNRRLKDYSELLEMESTDPDSENIFKENLYSNYYTDRPEELQDLCLHDFMKPRLVNHKIFDPEKEDQRKGLFLFSYLALCTFQGRSVFS